MKKVLSSFIAVVLSIFLFCSLFLIVLFSNVEHNLSKDVIVKTIKKVEIVRDQDEYSVPGELSSFIDQVYQVASSVGIEEKLVDQFLNSDTLKETIATIVGNTTEMLLSGESENFISLEEWNQMLDQVMEVTVEELQLDVSDEAKDAFLNKMKEETNPMIEKINQAQIIEENFDTQELETIRYIFSEKTKVILWSSLLITLILIFLLQRKTGAWLLYLGVPTLVLALLLLFSGMVMIPLVSVLTTDGSLTIAMMNIMIQNIQHSFFISGIVLFLIAIACFLFHHFLFKSKKEGSPDKENVIE